MNKVKKFKLSIIFLMVITILCAISAYLLWPNIALVWSLFVNSFTGLLIGLVLAMYFNKKSIEKSSLNDKINGFTSIIDASDSARKIYIDILKQKLAHDSNKIIFESIFKFVGIFKNIASRVKKSKVESELKLFTSQKVIDIFNDISLDYVQSLNKKTESYFLSLVNKYEEQIEQLLTYDSELRNISKNYLRILNEELSILNNTSF